MSAAHDDEFTEYVTVRLRPLRRTAYLLCWDWEQADDLVQTAITRLYAHWGRAREVEYLDAYTRTILVREFLNDRSSGWRRRVVPATQPREPVSVVPEDREGLLDLRAALAGLAPRQRATLVLRFYCDLNVDQTAQMLGCSAGTVKSQTAKGLDSLRRSLEPAAAVPPGGSRPTAPRQPGPRQERVPSPGQPPAAGRRPAYRQEQVNG